MADEQRTNDEKYAEAARRFDASDRYLLALAGVAVAIYMIDLLGIWRHLGVHGAYRWVALVIDSVFVVDLVLKVRLLGRRYVRSPWFTIDLLSALPILASLAAVPSFLEGLRVARGIRLFRMLRMLRTLRVLRGIRLFQSVEPPPEDSPERRHFERTLFVGVIIYTALFLALMTLVHLGAPEGELVSVTGPSEKGTFSAEMRTEGGQTDTLQLRSEMLMRSANEIEFYFVVGSVLGMLLIVVVARAQVPAVASHQVRTLLNVALPVQVAEHFMQRPEDYDRTVSMPATIMFGDIRGFTSAVEALGDDLQSLKHHLERALDAVVRVHARYDLIVDKFIGDAVMSFRGGDLVEGTPEEHAWRVVRAGIESARALIELNDPHFHEMRIGGASATDALIGTFGTSSRLSYTVLGDRVNLAARLESAGKPLKVGNLFCGRTRELTAGREDIVWRKVGDLVVEGKTEAVPVHEAFDPADELAWLEGYEAALAAYEAGDFAAARAGFEATDAARPDGDGPSRFYLPRVERLLTDGAPDGWSATLALAK